MLSTSFSLRPSNASLYIESARIYDEGVYVCVASNTLGQSRDAAMLRVAGKFYIILNEKDLCSFVFLIPAYLRLWECILLGYNLYLDRCVEPKKYAYFVCL